MMSNRKTTKRALLTSVMALVMCVVMLVGTTFAWFTDTASTGVNKIQAGNLKMEVSYTLDGEEWAKLDGATDIFQKGLWEPGHSEVVGLKIHNAGNLALKYSISMNIAEERKGVNKDGEEFALSDYLKVKTNTSAGVVGEVLVSAAFANRNTGKTWQEVDFKAVNAIATDVPQPVDSATYPDQYYVIIVTMPESVGNEANAISVDKAPFIEFGIKVMATQYTHESDSFDNKYDKNAQYDDVTYMGVTDQDSLNEALNNTEDSEKPPYVSLPTGSFTVDSENTIGANTTLAGAGKDKTTLNVEKANVANDNITIKDMTINGEAPAGNDGALRIGGKNTVIDNVIFNGQGFNGDTKGISVTGENLTIRNSKISGAFRGITFWDNIGGDNLIENCTIDNVIYTFNVNAQTVKPGTTLTVKNSTLNGWTSYSSCMTHVTFDGCDLGKANGYAYLVAYADSTFTNCTFHDGYQVAANATGGAKTLTFNNCKLADGTVITAENFAEKLGDVDDDMKAFTVIVDGVTVNWN